MPQPAPSSPRRALRRLVAVFTIGVCVGVVPPAIANAADPAPPPPAEAGGSTTLGHDWAWPVVPFRLVRPFVAPAHEFGPGHRGIDLLPTGEGVVHAPAAGVVAFSGEVAGRGVITVDHGGGFVSTLEPVDSALEAGTAVAASSPLGTVGLGGHTEPGALHFGVRKDGAYINPLLLLDGVPRAVLLPCC